MGDNYSEIAVKDWEDKWTPAAMLLAEGYTVKEVAERVDQCERTIYNWKSNPIFAMEVDRLSVTWGLASRAERSRILMRMAREKMNADGTIEMDDTSLMDILKEMRMMIEGTRIDITPLVEALTAEAGSVAGSGPDRGNPQIEAGDDNSK